MPVRRKCNTSPPTSWQPPSGGEKIELKIKVVTPMFGGGYEAGVVDDIVPIRAAAIRGCLRFWWRATAGAKYGTAKDLYEAEEALWGGAAHEVESDGEKETVSFGKISLSLAVTNKGQSQKCATYKKRHNGDGYKSLPDFNENWPPYALQPFQGKAKGNTIEQEPSTALLNAEFDLTVRIAADADAAEVRQALAAWIRYGGLGARSRRGCGSIAASEPFVLSELADPILEELTTLKGAIAVWGTTVNDPIVAWDKAVNVYKDFRQKPGFARNPGQQQNRPGRSRWPEPDAIRRSKRQHASSHQPSHPVEKGFPRADLGLPIIFHFKDHNDPGDVTLQGPRNGFTRFASPVITKVVAVNGGYRPLVLIFNSPHVWHLGDLQLDGQPITRSQVELTAWERKQVQPLAGTDIREALIQYVEGRWETTREVLK